jgi:hypothetical protein
MTYIKESKAILETACGDSEGCETSRLPYFLDIWLSDGGEVVSLRACRALSQEDSL